MNDQSVNPRVGAVYVDESDDNRLGFTPYAELWNGRLAMLGFAALLVIELVTGKGLLALLQIQ